MLTGIFPDKVLDHTIKTAILAGVILSFSTVCMAAGTDPGTAHRNVILLIIDALRPDHLGCYGYPRNTSPAIDELAGESVVFENAFAQSCYTIASMTSIFTSLYPKSHGVFYVLKDRFPAQIQTAAELFQKNGFATAWFSDLKQPHLDINAGFGRGFDTTEELDPRLESREKVFAWIRLHKDRPFFLALNARTVHDPYAPDPEYMKMFPIAGKKKIIETAEELEKVSYPAVRRYIRKNLDGEALRRNRELLRAPYTKENAEKLTGLLPSEKQLEVINMKRSFYFSRLNARDARTMEQIRSLYDACILETDRKLFAPLTALLKDLGIYDDTMLIITADHGEEFAEHGGLGHEFKLYDELIHVPLIVKAPGYRGGVRIRSLAESIDILPTLCEYAGIRTPREFQGRSLMFLFGGDGDGAVNEFVYGENPKELYIRSLEWKLIVPYDPKARRYLFGLERDPGEENNFYDQGSSEGPVKLLETKLQEMRRSLPLYQEGENYFLPEIPPEMRKRIKETGYW
jgi:arylsulfatase A-like enzyme